MDPRIQVRNEARRGCGRRDKKGALYLVDLDPDNFRNCGKLPVPLGPCPVCGEGIKPARQWVWIESEAILAEARKKPCAQDAGLGCLGCAMDTAATTGRAGLLWIGEKYYSPASFNQEAAAMGISRRVAFLPKGFEIGSTWVFLAHIHAVKGKDGKLGPGIIAAYRPKAAEIVCDGTETAGEVDGYIKRGLTPVKVNPIGGEANQAPVEPEDDEVGDL